MPITKNLQSAIFEFVLALIESRVAAEFEPRELASSLIAIAEEKQFPIEGLLWWVHAHPPGAVLRAGSFRQWVESVWPEEGMAGHGT